MDKLVSVRGLRLKLFPVLEGQGLEPERNGRQLLIDNVPLGDNWVHLDWQPAKPGARIEFTWVGGRLGGTVSEPRWFEGYIELVEGEFHGPERFLQGSSLGRWATFSVVSYDDAVVEPRWLFPKEIALPWWVYQTILTYLDGWEPFRPFTIAELWSCVRYAVGCHISWSFERLTAALSVEGNFALPDDLKRVHNALKLASRLKEQGWPLENDEGEEKDDLMNLWFDLETCRWLWLKPDSLFEDRLGLCSVPFTLEEFKQDFSLVAIKLLFPTTEPFFSVRGLPFESTAGPA